MTTYKKLLLSILCVYFLGCGKGCAIGPTLREYHIDNTLIWAHMNLASSSGRPEYFRIESKFPGLIPEQFRDIACELAPHEIVPFPEISIKKLRDLKATEDRSTSNNEVIRSFFIRGFEFSFSGDRLVFFYAYGASKNKDGAVLWKKSVQKRYRLPLTDADVHILFGKPTYVVERVNT